jgi:hypothetical protein
VAHIGPLRLAVEPFSLTCYLCAVTMPVDHAHYNFA